MVIGILAKATDNLGPAFSPERLEYALQMTLLGLGAVFSVLAVIWLVLVLFKFFLYDVKKDNKNSSKEKAEKAVKSVNVEKQIEVANTTTVETSNDATIAAIMAAISAYISEDPELSKEYAGGFRVVSFKRVRAKASWNTKNN